MAMKDSGIEWIGPVPGHWGVGSLRWLATCRSGLSVPTEDFQKDHSDTYHIPVIGSNGSIGFTNRPSINSEIIAVGRVGSCGSVRIVDVPAWVTDNALIIEPTDRLDIRFLSWVLQARNLPELATKTAQPLITGGQILNQKIPYTSLPEQTRIANFLDEQTARIDALIAEKERLVGTLKNLRAEAIDHTVLGGEIKERGQPLNGLHVLGRAPRGWDVSRMKYELDYVTSGSRGWADYYADDGAIFIRIGNLTRDSITLDLADVQRVVLPNAAEGVRARVRPGDLLISITAYLGSVAVAPSEIEEAYVSQHVSLARPNFVRAIPDWLGYVVLSGVGKTFFDLQAYGGTKIQLSLDDIREMPVPLPSLDEQKRRIARLERRLAQLAHLEKHVAEHIALLREYRSSLISAAVTGQLDIDNFGRGAA